METTTLEQSKRIQELGIEIHSEFVWIMEYNGPVLKFNTEGIRKYCVYYPAPTEEEIVERLPNSKELYITVNFPARYGVSCYERINKKSYKAQAVHSLENKSYTHALADMLIWCGENGHLKGMNDFNKVD